MTAAHCQVRFDGRAKSLRFDVLLADSEMAIPMVFPQHAVMFIFYMRLLLSQISVNPRTRARNFHFPSLATHVCLISITYS
jgi:hypothetical protein